MGHTLQQAVAHDGHPIVAGVFNKTTLQLDTPAPQRPPAPSMGDLESPMEWCYMLPNTCVEVDDDALPSKRRKHGQVEVAQDGTAQTLQILQESTGDDGTSSMASRPNAATSASDVEETLMALTVPSSEDSSFRLLKSNIDGKQHLLDARNVVVQLADHSQVTLQSLVDKIVGRTPVSGAAARCGSGCVPDSGHATIFYGATRVL